MFELSGPPENHGKTVDLQARVSEIAADVHALSHNLHWSKLDLLGFATGMEMLCKEVGEQYQVRVALHAHDVPAQCLRKRRCACTAFSRKRFRTPRSTAGSATSTCACGERAMT